MNAETAPQRKGFKAMLQQVRASLFAPLRDEQVIKLESAAERSTALLDDLDRVLSRSKAAQVQRSMKQ